MAAIEGVTPESGHRDSTFADEAGRPIGEYQPSALERLTRLHSESVETARLANQLGRVPMAAFALSAGCVVVAVAAATAGTASMVMLSLWVVFVAAAVVAMIRLARHALRSAFELLPLRAFALDLNAVMLYAGFAWSAGAFLGLPAAATPFSLALFAIGAAVAMGAILRARTPTLYFLVPNTILSAAAALAGGGGSTMAAIILVFGLSAAVALEILERMSARRAYAPAFPSLTFP
jgi:hypothetical protein